MTAEPVQPPIWRPTVDIDLDALCANYRLLAAAAPGAEPAAVVKCDGYGLRAGPVAQALAIAENCRTFFVAYPEEGAALRGALAETAPHATIYVFNGPRAGALDLFVAHRLTPILNSHDQATLWTSAHPGAAAGLQVDTGMNRIGAPYTELAAIASLKGLVLNLVMSHLACSSDPAHAMNAAQLEMFEQAAALFPGVRRSLAASSGALLSSAYHFDLARLGIGLYGGSPLDDRAAPIRPVARLTAPVTQLRDARPGETVGYGVTHAFGEARRLAIVQLGYGDGFPRAGGNKAKAFVGGAPCPVVGRVSMDYIALDITNAPNSVAPGDRAEFFGPNLSIDDAADSCGTIPYELLTGLGARVHRRYLWRAAPALWRAPEQAGSLRA